MIKIYQECGHVYNVQVDGTRIEDHNEFVEFKCDYGNDSALIEITQGEEVLYVEVHLPDLIEAIDVIRKTNKLYGAE